MLVVRQRFVSSRVGYSDQAFAAISRAEANFAGAKIVGPACENERTKQADSEGSFHFPSFQWVRAVTTKR
jgi:hypothetical protein